MISDVPLGAFLSGGLDSSIIVHFAKQFNPDISCFSIAMQGGQDDGFVDDLPYAIRVAKHFGVNLNVIKVDSTLLSSSLIKMVEQLDEPLADPAPIHVSLISSLARENGIKVLLSGAGGDDIFSGYLRHKALYNERFLNWIPSNVKEFAHELISKFPIRHTSVRRISKYLGAMSKNGNDGLIEYFRWSGRKEICSLFSMEFKKRVDNSIPELPMLEFLNNYPNDISPLSKMLSLEQRFFLSDHNLIYTDKMSMAHGVEVRVPFLDRELVEFASHIPDNLRIKNGETKWILKKIMEPYLPHDIIYRPKTGFGAPIRRWMRFELRELLLDVLSFDSLKRRGIFDPVAVEKLMKDTWSGRSDGSYTLLSLLCIELWFRRFIDNTHANQFTS